MQNNIYKTKSIVEAGLLTTITVILSLLYIYMPIFSVIVLFAIPIPITLIYIRHNFRIAIISVLVSGIILALLYNPLMAASIMFSYGLTGIALGYCIKKEASFAFTLMMLTLAFMVTTVITAMITVTVIYPGGLVNFLDTNIKAVKDTMNSAVSIYSSLGVSKDQLSQFNQVLELFQTSFVLTLIPAMLILISIVYAYANYVVAKILLKRLRYNMKEVTPFTEIYVNAKVGIVIIVLVLIGNLLKARNMLIGDYVFNSSNILLQYVFWFAGMSVIAYLLRRRVKLPKAVVIIILIFTFSFMQIYMLVGIVDMVIDIRKINPNRIMRR